MILSEAVNKKEIDIHDYYNALLNQQEPDAGVEGLLSTTLNMGPQLLKDTTRGFTEIPVFTKLLNNKDIKGSQLVASIKDKAASAGDAAKKIADGDKFVRGGGVADDQLATTTKSLTKAALQVFSKYNFVRGVSQFLGRNIGGVPRNTNIKDVETAKNAAGFISNVFGQVGGAANAAFGKARNGRMAQLPRGIHFNRYYKLEVLLTEIRLYCKILHQQQMMKIFHQLMLLDCLEV